MKYLNNIGSKAKKAFKSLNNISDKKVKSVLETYNKNLFSYKKQIIKENIKDLKNNHREYLKDRLILDNKKIENIRYSISEIIKFKNPVGKILAKWKRPSGIYIKKISTPIGIIGVIYESRPNVTADVAALCFKSRNCSILRGGSEAFYSNKLLANLFRDSLRKNNIDKNCVQFIENTDRKLVRYLLSNMTNFIDVIVPRGGKGLIRNVNKYSKVPTIGHLEGLCHIYIDSDSNINMSSKIVMNSKMRKTSICGAVETILIHKKVLKSHGMPIIKKLISSNQSV